MIERLQKLQANKKQYADNGILFKSLETNEGFRKEVEILAKTFLGRTVSGCKNCYADAYIELINLNIKKAMEKAESKFKLRAGVLIRDINGDVSKNMTQANISNDLALYHLKTNPNNKKFFHELPENVDELLEEYTLPKGAKIIEVKKENTDKNQSEIDTGELNKKINSLQDDVSNKDKEIIELKKDKQEIEEKLQTYLEKDFINEIADKLLNGTTKTSIKEEYKTTEYIGNKKLTGSLLGEYIKQAEDSNKEE